MDALQTTDNEKRIAAISALATTISALIPLIDKDFKYVGIFLGGLNVLLLIFAASGKLNEWHTTRRTQTYLVFSLVALSIGVMSLSIIHNLRKPASSAATVIGAATIPARNDSPDVNITNSDNTVVNTGTAGDITIGAPDSNHPKKKK